MTDFTLRISVHNNNSLLFADELNWHLQRDVDQVFRSVKALMEFHLESGRLKVRLALFLLKSVICH